VFHIDWWENQIDYYVDGVWVATHTISITGNMRPVASMINGSSQEPLLIDWMRMTPPGAPPYAPSCSFISGIFNAGFEARWTNLAWTGTNPSGTTISFLTRSGNTEFPGDGTWSGWEPVVDGNISCPNAAYIQYRVVVSTTDPNLTPIIENVTLTFTLAEPTVALLASFTAEADLHNVLLEWETASELALVGFNLYRSDSDVGVKTKVNFELIPASYPGQSLGDSYQFTDNGEQGKNYFYWLEMVKTNGTSLTEPISVTIDYGIYLPMIVK